MLPVQDGVYARLPSTQRTNVSDDKPCPGTVFYRLLDFSNNSFSGTMPTTLGSMAALSYLDLSSNALTGSIPTVIGALRRLTLLRLSSNQLSGAVPDLPGLAALMYGRCSPCRVNVCGRRDGVPTVSAPSPSPCDLCVQRLGAVE